MFVLDTNIVVAGLFSRTGASHWLLERALRGSLPIALSVALFLEYEDVLGRTDVLRSTWADPSEVGGILDALAARATIVTPIYFRQRPVLADPGDEMVLECAVQAHAEAIVTLNERDFAEVKRGFGIDVVKPGSLVASLRKRGMP